MSRTKKHKKKWFSSIAGIAFALTLTGLAVFAGFYMEKNTEIKALQFTGHYFTDEELLVNTIDSPIGMMADSIRFESIFESLQSLPYVKDVNVTMNIRGTLTFGIREHEPIAMLVDGSNRSYVAEGGIKLPVYPEKIRNVPLVYGFAAQPVADTLKSDAYRQVEDFLISARQNNLGWITISEVAWNKHEGVVALTHDNGVKLLFGQDNFDRKLRHWQAFYTDVVSKKGIQSFNIIDLRFRDQIVTRN